MSNTNRDYAIVYDIKNSSLTLSRPLVFYITDKNTSNIFIRLVTKISVGDGIDQYTDIENASNYILMMRVIKPNDEVTSIKANQRESESIFEFDLTEDFKDIPGTYICELMISTIVSGRQELITSDEFTYKVKRSVLSRIDQIIEHEETTVEKLLNELDATKAELSSKVNKGEGGVITNAMLSQEVKEAMTGGSVAVVGKNTVLEENIAPGQVTPSRTSFFDELSILTNEQFKDGKFWNNGSLTDWTEPSWSYIENSIPVTPEKTYTITGVTDYHIDLLNSGGIVTRHITINLGGNTFATQSNEVAIHVSCLTSEKNELKIINSNYGVEQIKPEYLKKGSDLLIEKVNQLNQDSFIVNGNGDIAVRGNKVTFSDIRMSHEGNFYQLEAPITLDMGDYQFGYCKATFTNKLIVDAGDLGKCYKVEIEAVTDKPYWIGANDLKSNETIILFKNDGILKSNYIYIEKILSKLSGDPQGPQDPQETINTTTIKVKQGGQVGTDCDYTDINEAMNSITDNSYYNRYTVLIQDGVYDYSNNGENIGVKLKNYVTLEGINKSTVFIQKFDDNFAWGKATIDVGDNPVDYAKVKNITLLSKNCKCPLHIDSNNLRGTFEGENLDLINLQDKGTGDFPANGSPNCGAFGWMNNCHITLKNVRANGKLWGHNYCDTNSNGTLEFINCNSKQLQFGDLTSQGNDKIIVKGCRADVLEHLWFSESESTKGRKPSYEFDMEGNNIGRTVLKDHAGAHDALNDYFKGKYPFNLNEIHTYCYCTEDVQVGDIVYRKDFNNLFEVTKVENEYKVGRVIENKFNNMVMIERI